MKKAFLFAAALSVLTVSLVAAQNLLDNDAYRKAVELRNEANTAYEQGDYAKAQQLSAESQQYAQEALKTAQEMALAYRATNWLDLANARIQYATSIDAADHYPDAWSSAQSAYGEAKSTYTAKQYEKSISASQSVVAALANVKPFVAVAVAPPPPPPAPVKPAQPLLPAYYTVRLIPQNRDCFWNIAGYPFVYNDPLKWPILYQANKQVLQDPNNPNLIQPGMVFVIPSINGEKREGMYQPPKQ